MKNYDVVIYLEFGATMKGNSLVYGIYVVEISAYMLKYQHC